LIVNLYEVLLLTTIKHLLIVLISAIFLISCNKDESDLPGSPQANVNLDSIVGKDDFGSDFLRIIFKRSQENWRMEKTTSVPWDPEVQYKYSKSSSIRPGQVLTFSSNGDTSFIFLTYIETPKGFKISRTEESGDYNGLVLEWRINFEYNSTGDLLVRRVFGFSAGFSDFIQYSHGMFTNINGNVKEIEYYFDQDAYNQYLSGIQATSYNPVLTGRTEMDYDNNLNPLNNYYMPISYLPFTYSHFSSNNMIFYSYYNADDILEFTVNYQVFVDPKGGTLANARPVELVRDDRRILFYYSNQ